MKHDFTVYTDSGLPDSLTSEVQIVFTLSPSVHGPETHSHNAVVCKSMRFGMNGTRPSSNLAASPHGVHEEFLWEWETIFAFSKYESINKRQRRLVGDLWPTSPGQSRTIGNQSAHERSAAELSSESVFYSQTVEDEWTTLGSSTLGSSILGSSTFGLSNGGSSTFHSSTSGSSHADRSSSSRAKASTTETQKHEEWGRPQSYYDLNPLNDASVVAINDSGKSQNVALYIRNPRDQFFDTIAVYDSVHHGEKIVASSFLVLQAYIVVGRDVQEYDLAEGFGSPIFTKPLACDSIPPSSKWRLCVDERRKTRLIMDDLDLWCMKKTVETLWRTVDGMKTQVTDFTETKVTSLDERLTTAESRIETNSRESNTRFAHLEDTVGGHGTELIRLPALEKRAGETDEKLTATQRSVEETRSEVQAVKVRVDALESQRSRADQEVSKLQTSLSSTNTRVTTIEESLADTREGLTNIVEKTFRDSSEIRTNLESRIEKQCTTIVNSTFTSDVEPRLSAVETGLEGMKTNLASSVETRLSVVEKKTVGVKETVHDTIREVLATDVASQISNLRTGAQKTDTRIAQVESRLESVVKTVDDNHTKSSVEREKHVQETKHKISLVESSVHAVDVKVNKGEVRVTKVEASLSELEQSIPRTIVETVHNNKEIRERMETTVRDSKVIREFVKKSASDAFASDVEPRLWGVETLIEAMEPRVVTVESALESMKTTLSSNVESRLSVVEKKTHDVKDTVQNTIRDVLTSDLNHRISEIATRTDGMGTRLSAVETNAEGSEERINQSETRLETLNKTVNDHHTESSTSLSSLKTRVDKTERTLSESVNKVEVRVEKVETSLSKLQQTITGTIVETVQNNKEIREKMETTVRDSQVIRDVMNKNTREVLALDVEPRLSGVEMEIKGMKNTLSSGVESRLLNVEKKTLDVKETVQATIRDVLTSDVIPRITVVETGAKDTNTRITQSGKRVDALDKWVNEKVTELTTGLVKYTEETRQKLSRTEKSIHMVDVKVDKVEARVQKTETEVSELQQTIRNTIVETVKNNQEIRENIEKTTCNSQVIREVMNKNTRDILASDVEPRLSGVETLIESMEPRLLIVETEVGGLKNTLASGVESRLRVVETGAEAMETRVTQIGNRVDTLEKTTHNNHTVLTTGLSSMETRVEKTERSLSMIGESAKKTEVRVENVETSVSDLQKSIHHTIMDSFHNSKELQDRIESTTRDSNVIREVIVKNTRDVLASDIEPRLSGVENLIEAMEPRLVTVETDIKGMRNTLASGVESRLSVIERKTLDVKDTVQRTIRDILASDVNSRFLDVENKFSQSSAQTQSRVTSLQQKLETSTSDTQKGISQLQKTVTDLGAALGTNRNNLMDAHRAVETVANKLSGACHEIDELKKYSNSANNDKLSSLETRVHSIDSRVVEITTQIGGLNESLSLTRDEMTTSVADVRKDTEGLSTKLSARVASLEELVPATERRVTLVEGRLGSTEDRLDGVAISVVSIEDTVKSHKETKADKSQVELLEQHITQTKKEMGFLADLKTDVQTMERTLKTSVATCETKVATCQSDVADCQSSIIDCQSKVAICQSSVSDCQSKVAICQSSVATCQSDLHVCQSKVAACQTIVATCQSGVTACQSQVAVVGTKVQDLSTTTTSALSEHQTSITNTQADVTKLRESLTKLEGSTITGARVSEISDELQGRLATAEEQLRTRLTKVQTTMESRTKHTHEILLKTRQDLSIVHQIAVDGQRHAFRVNTLAEKKAGVHQTMVGEQRAECTAGWHRSESSAHTTQDSMRLSSVSGGHHQTSSTTSISGGRSGVPHSGPRVYAL